MKLLKPDFDRPETDQLLVEADAARFLHVSVHTLQAWRTKRIGPEFVRLSPGGGIRYRRSALLTFLDRQTVPTESTSRPPQPGPDAVATPPPNKLDT